MLGQLVRLRTWIGSNGSASLQYLYFMRFSLLLWLFPFVFAVLDEFLTTTLTRGIWVPERWQGFTCITFFLLASGCMALISARIVAINGVERFAAKCSPCVKQALGEHPECAEEHRQSGGPPDWVRSLLVNDAAAKEPQALITALIPALLSLIYAAVCAHCEQVSGSQAARGLALGSVLAGFFWYVVNALYYLAYERPDETHNTPLVMGKNAARTILLPRRWLRLKMPGEGILAGGPPHTLEDITTSLRSGSLSDAFRRIVKRLASAYGLPGYVYPEGRLYEAQLFGIIAAFGFFFLFLVLYPLTAPGRTVWAFVAIFFMLLAFFYIASIIFTGSFPVPTQQNQRLLKLWKIGLTVVPGLFYAAVIWLWLCSSPDRFPTLASVLLLIIVLTWVLSSAAFFLDRFRVPVLTFILVATLIPRMVHCYEWFGGDFEEHYLSTTKREDSASLPTPAKILADKLASIHDDGPLIIVTATGGGLHASAWTTQVLRQLYLALEEKLPGTREQAHMQAVELMRTHLLLLSTVSGGSVGLQYYLRHYTINPPRKASMRWSWLRSAPALKRLDWDLPTTISLAQPFRDCHGCGGPQAAKTICW